MNQLLFIYCEVHGILENMMIFFLITEEHFI